MDGLISTEKVSKNLYVMKPKGKSCGSDAQHEKRHGVWCAVVVLAVVRGCFNGMARGKYGI
ncbi:hypothetical protein CW714_10265 [Methanophagales archaeon]|nr:MAG: hypothetical protein CW714_10265 [Methanophagales archaeon]